MKVFLVGGTGLLGSAAAAELIRRGHQVHAIALPPVPEGAGLPPEMKLEFKNYLTITDSELHGYMTGCDGFVFASGVDERVDGPSPILEFYNKHNLYPLDRMLRTAKECGVKNAAICGSYFSYFDKIWPEKQLYHWHPYIHSRRDQEKMAMDYADTDFNVGILELPYIFGAQQGREPVWTLIVKIVRGMMGATMYPRGGTAMVTRRQVGQALAGALEKTKGGQCWPIGYWNMKWKELLPIVHKYMGMPKRRVITIPDWMLKLGMKGMEKQLRKPGAEGGLYMPKFPDIQCAQTYVDKALGCVPLGVEDDDIDAAIGESIRLAADILDGKIKNYATMIGE
ncbi:MAG: NAD-dependent epimerase/dehydratase family protein [Treponema sp.]|nr:NAD-dependent epimerase/dehydratase family protein [Treponema sp.]